MKKFLFLAAVALTATLACSKSETATSPEREVTFQIAHQRTATKATSATFYDNGNFGTYSWYNGSTTFMVNEKVGLDAGEWKTVDNTFYWPKTGSLDFISYAPFAGTSNTAGTVPAVTPTTITYTDYTVGSDDVLYADKVNCAANVDEVQDDHNPESGYNGVPTVFRHALAQVRFRILANFTAWDDAVNGSHTDWEVTLNHFTVSGLYQTGSCALTLDSDNTSWVKPQTTVLGDTYHVWTSPAGATAAQDLVASPLVLTTSAQALTPVAGYVLPQVLEDGVQTISIDAHIKTTVSNGKVIEEDYTGTFNLSDFTSCKAWEMNQVVTYTVKFKPTAKVSEDNTPEDVIITFDPAVVDWEQVDATAVIQL